MTEKKKLRKCNWCGKHFIGITKNCSKKCLSELRSFNITNNKNPMYESERFGELNPNWHGGKKFEEYSPDFNSRLKNIIKKRDNDTCQECGKRGFECINKNGVCYGLQVHHIDYNKHNNLVDNLICLCNHCHSKTNFNRADWTNHVLE